MVPRYEGLSEEIIKCYKDEQVSSKEIDSYFPKEFRLLEDPEKLSGGRIRIVCMMTK